MSASAWWKRTTAKLGMGADSGNPGRADAASAMGRRLRRKFILVAMGAVTAVLTLIIAGINIVNYSHVCKMADARLDYILGARTASIGRMSPRPISARMWAPVRPLPVTGWSCAPGTSKV